MRSPKQDGQPPWYPYYAGFSAGFAEDALTLLQDLCGNGLAIDPWNGTGTTTTTAWKLEFESVAGFDINPALTMVAQGRNLPLEYQDELPAMTSAILGIARANNDAIDNDASDDADPLAKWFMPDAVAHLRALQRAIDVFGKSPSYCIDPKSAPQLRAFYYTAAFTCIRTLLSTFRATNPTWLKTPKAPSNRLSPSPEPIDQLFRESVAGLTQKLALKTSTRSLPVLRTADSTRLPLGNGEARCCLTSPPYCTRIDYVVAARAELAFMGLQDIAYKELREASLGSAITSRNELGWVSQSSIVLQLLRRISEHPTKAADTYYARYFTAYFHGLEHSLNELDRVLYPGGPLAIVLQDSYFKDIHIDLQAIVTELVELQGRTLVRREDYGVTRSWARLNPRSRPYRNQSPTQESFMLFAAS